MKVARKRGTGKVTIFHSLRVESRMGDPDWAKQVIDGTNANIRMLFFKILNLEKL